MEVSCSIIIPYRDNGCEYRRNNLDTVIRYLTRHIPEAEIIVASDEDFWYFNRSLAINNGFRKSRSDIIVVHDSDMICDIATLRRSIKFVRLGWYKMAYPWTRLWKLKEEYSNQIINNLDLVNKGIPTDVISYVSKDSPGGVFACSAEAYKHVRGHDERFVGWGGEDNAFRFSIQGSYGRKSVTRIATRALHLWHPTYNRYSVKTKNGNNKLYREYRSNWRRVHRIILKRPEISQCFL